MKIGNYLKIKTNPVVINVYHWHLDYGLDVILYSKKKLYMMHMYITTKGMKL